MDFRQWRNKDPDNLEEGRFMRRSRIDILADILFLSRRGILKTRILYGCNLSFNQLNSYLNFLINSGLIEEIFGLRNSIFKTTERGIDFLIAYQRLKSILYSSNNWK